MSTAATPKAEQGPEGASPCDCAEADTRGRIVDGDSKEAEA